MTAGVTTESHPMTRFLFLPKLSVDEMRASARAAEEAVCVNLQLCPLDSPSWIIRLKLFCVDPFCFVCLFNQILFILIGLQLAFVCLFNTSNCWLMILFKCRPLNAGIWLHWHRLVFLGFFFLVRIETQWWMVETTLFIYLFVLQDSKLPTRQFFALGDFPAETEHLTKLASVTGRR